MEEAFGYKALLLKLLEYHIKLLRRFKHDGYDQLFSLIALSLPEWDEKKLRNIITPILRESDAIFYIEGNLILLLPGSDWNGALKVHHTICDMLDLHDIEDAIVEYPTDGEEAFALIGNLYNKLKQNWKHPE